MAGERSSSHTSRSDWKLTTKACCPTKRIVQREKVRSHKALRGSLARAREPSLSLLQPGGMSKLVAARPQFVVRLSFSYTISFSPP
jgi:hypothetical protein